MPKFSEIAQLNGVGSPFSADGRKKNMKSYSFKAHAWTCHEMAFAPIFSRYNDLSRFISGQDSRLDVIVSPLE